MIQPLKKEMRRHATCLERTMQEMEAFQRRLLADISDDELTAMACGKRPLSPQVHFVAVLQDAVLIAEDAALTLRRGALEVTLQKLDRSWRKGEPPDSEALEAVVTTQRLKGGA